MCGIREGGQRAQLTGMTLVACRVPAARVLGVSLACIVLLTQWGATLVIKEKTDHILRLCYFLVSRPRGLTPPASHQTAHTPEHTDWHCPFPHTPRVRGTPYHRAML